MVSSHRRRARSPHLRRWIAAACLFASTALALPAAAQDAAMAERLFEEGRQLLDAGDYDGACAKFEASMTAEPSGGTALNLARCNELRGRTATAWAEFKRAASLFSAVGDADRTKFANDRAAEIEPKLSKLTIEVTAPEGVEVRRNGTPLDPAAFGTSVPVDPGKVTITASAPGYAPWSTTVTVGANADDVVVRVPEMTRAASEGAAEPIVEGDGGPHPMTVAGIAMMGVGGVAVVVGAVLGVTVLSDVSEAEDDGELCPGKVCTAAGDEHLDAAEGRATVTNILIGAGAAVAVGGLVMFLLAPDDDGGAEMVGDARLGASFVVGGARDGFSGVRVAGTF